MIIVRIWEGLGNQLFQYAYAKALEQRTGKKVLLDIQRIFKEKLEHTSIERPYALDKFNITLSECKDIEKRYFFLQRKNKLQENLFYLSLENIIVPGFYQEYDTEYKEWLYDIRGDWYLMGWFQQERYFKEFRDILLQEFSLKQDIKITKRFEEILETQETVSIHIRRSDFKKYNNVLPYSYYLQAISFITNMLNAPYYCVFSDDIEWVKENMDLGDNVYFVSDVEKLKDYEELIMMSKCKNNIIANSTFSWWGAWLNQNKEKIVICPDMNNVDIMPSEWIRI